MVWYIGAVVFLVIWSVGGILFVICSALDQETMEDGGAEPPSKYRVIKWLNSGTRTADAVLIFLLGPLVWLATLWATWDDAHQRRHHPTR